MAINYPYYRIFRPPLSPHQDRAYEYLWQHKYASDARELALSYNLLERGLQTLFEFIEPTENNLSTYSHRIYELLFRAATEFETHCKRILGANRYTHKNQYNIEDYFHINQATKWSDYVVLIPSWRNRVKILHPFQEWESGTYKPLPWYQSYNHVKHDRFSNFEKASFENVLLSISAVLVAFASQFTLYQIAPYKSRCSVLSTTVHTSHQDIAYQITDYSMFGICYPTWEDNEKYNIDWDKIEKEPDPLQQFLFS